VKTTVAHPSRRGVAASLAAAALVGLLAVGTGPIAVSDVLHLSGRKSTEGPSGVASAAPSTASIPGSGDRPRTTVGIQLVTGDETATATLDDTPQARAFAATLPITVEMEDPFGQAKTGRLPRALALDHPERSRNYAAGDLSYWSVNGSIAVVYDALGWSVPPPGLVRLGTVQTGLRAIATAGNHFTMTIKRR
jgi:hypothetical protein